MKKKRKLNYRKVILSYLITIIIAIIILFLLPNTPTYNYIWLGGFVFLICMLTCLVEGGDE